MRAATLHRSGAFSAASSGARLYARECTCTRYFLSVSEKLARPKIRPENSLSSHFRPRPKSVPDPDSNEAGWFRLVVGFREKFSPLRNSIRCSLLSKRNEFEDQGNVKRGSSLFCSSAYLDFGRKSSKRFERGDVFRPRSFRCYILHRDISRCPTAFLLFTRFLYAISRTAVDARYPLPNLFVLSSFPPRLPVL